MSSVTVSSGTVLDIDVPEVSLTGTVTNNGNTPPTQSSGDLFLIDKTTGDSVYLGDTSTGSYSAQLIPGVYDLYYQHWEGNYMPCNQNALLGCVLFLGGP